MTAGIEMGRLAGTTPRLDLRARSAVGGGNGARTNLAAARAAAEEFEAVFLSTMLEGMFSGLNTDAPFGGGSSEKTYRSMLTSEYAREISRKGGIGIADQIAREMIAIQEASKR